MRVHKEVSPAPHVTTPLTLMRCALSAGENPVTALVVGLTCLATCVAGAHTEGGNYDSILVLPY